MDDGRWRTLPYPLLLAALLVLPGAVQADRRATGVPRELPLPDGCRSVEVPGEGAIYAAPSRDSRFLGRAVPGATFPIRGAVRGPGCWRLWLALGEDQWICGDEADLLTQAPAPRPFARVPAGQVLPWSYVFTAADHTRVYASETEAQARTWSTGIEWEANWGFAVLAEGSGGRDRVLQSLSRRYLRRRDVYRAEPSPFQGASFAELTQGAAGIPFGWVVAGAARAYRTPEDARLHPDGEGTLARLTPVRVSATRPGHDGVWARVDGGLWVRRERLRMFVPVPPPAEVRSGSRERWIDVDLDEQLLIAYEGTLPVYATVVSTGMPGRETVPGLFRIWSKYAVRTMDNTENAALPNHFRFADVPFVQFFDGDRALHGVYWHDDFGHPRSHGCVNLAPRDAEYLFRFTRQDLPDGWQSVALAHGRGTLVRVRGRTPVDR